MATDRPEFVDPFATPSTEEYDPNEYEGKFQEFGEGVVSGATKLVQGPLELLAQASDYTLGTDYHEDVVEGFESFRKDMGIDPQGLLGTIGEVGGQFVLPAGVAAKAVEPVIAVASICSSDTASSAIPPVTICVLLMCYSFNLFSQAVLTTSVHSVLHKVLISSASLEISV